MPERTAADVTSDHDAPTWRDISYRWADFSISLMLLGVLYGWTLFPRWLAFVVAWSGIIINGAATISGLILKASDR